MKKFFSAVLLIINLNCFAQPTKWFVSFSVGATLAGPSASLKQQLIRQGFDQTSTGNFLGLTWTSDYPNVTRDAAVLVRGGKKLNDRRSIYFVAGLSSKARVEGFKNQGYSDLFGIIGGSYGDRVSVSYQVYQLTAGYLYSFAATKIKLGFGPSLYVVDHKVEHNSAVTGKDAPLVPGVSFLARFPFGKERRLCGTELFVEGNMATPARIESSESEAGFRPGKASMVYFNAGLAFTFRKRQS